MPNAVSDPEKIKEDNLLVGAKGGMVSFVLQITALVLGFLNTVILARVLGADGLGEVVLAISILSIAAQLAGFGMDSAMMRFVPSYLEKKQHAELKGMVFFCLKFCLLLSGLLMAVILLLSRFISEDIFNSAGLMKLIPVIVFAIPANAINVVAGGILKGYKDTFRALLPQLLVSPLLKICIFIFLIFYRPVPLYAVVALLVSETLAMIFSLKFVLWKQNNTKGTYLKAEGRKVMGVASTMMFTGLSAYIFTNADLWTVGIFMSTGDVGVYGVVSKLVTLVAFSLGTFAAIIPPIISTIHTSGDRTELKRVVSESTRWILSMSVPIILVLTVEGRFILEYAYGKDFVIGFGALVILAVGQLINAGSGLVGYFLIMTGEHKTFMKINIFFGCLNIILNIILVPYFGIIGAALSTSFCLAMVNIVSVYIIHSKHSILTLARGVNFDILFLTVVAIIYYLINIMDFNMGYHFLLAIALTVYIGKSIIKGDLPLQYLTAKNLN
ncbi:MAG: flippase [Nitrospirae bacterium]|nr:flippase [Nitrospirota bacterium]